MNLGDAIIVFAAIVGLGAFLYNTMHRVDILEDKTKALESRLEDMENPKKAGIERWKRERLGEWTPRDLKCPKTRGNRL